MLKIILLILLLGTSPVLAQIAAIQGHSFLGGTQAVTSGLKSSNYMQGIVPYATICVYNTGTTAPATIYANASGAPLSSCFTSNASISTDPGGWIFWAAINQGLDVVMSGGVSPNMYPAPVTISDLYPSTQITSGCGTVCPISQGGTGATTAAGALSNLGGAPLTGTGTSGTWPISTTGNAATATNVTGTVAIANGGTGANNAAGALVNLGAYSATNPAGYITNSVTTLPSLSLPYSQLSGTVPTWNQSTTGNAATATNVPYSGLTGTVPTWNQNTTGNAATATQATNATNFNGGMVSATTGTFSGTVAAGATTPTTMGSNGVLLNGVPALQAQTSLGNYYSGGAGNLTGTGSDNTANGFQALYSNTTGTDNTANGYAALSVNTTGFNNTANGMYTLHANTTGFNNTANGFQALYSNTTGISNTANGFQAGQYIADAVTANQTSSYSVYEGFQAYPLANGDTNENVIGNGAIGNGSNTTTLGNGATVGTWLNGTQHIFATAPITSAGTVAAYSTNAGGAITSLNAASTVTITFANSGWKNAAFCVATPSVSLATAPYVSAISLTAVTFTFVALTGKLYYHCDGN
jgi:hypothetical protein